MKFESKTPEVFLPSEEVSPSVLQNRLHRFKDYRFDQPKEAVDDVQSWFQEWKDKELYKKLYPTFSWGDFCKVEFGIDPKQIEALDVVKAHDLDELAQTISRLNNTLIQKLEDAPKIIENGTGKTQNKNIMPQSDNINTLSVRGDSQDYIFGRLKRDAELGVEKAIEVVEKVKRGEFKSVRQVALEMGYRKPVKQKCLPMDVEKAVDKILKQMGEVYADELCTALYQRLREIHLQNSED